MNPAQRPITVLIAALGGEGGGVLADWLVDAATAQGFPVQSTSIPGVAQRTGATTYYLEIFPVRRDALNGKRPVFALTPSPGNIDVMVASELLEAARTMLNGYVSPERTTLIASTHRIFAIAEKSAMADGRFDGDRVLKAAEALAKRATLFDMAALAQTSGTVINAVLFGAMIGSGALPLSREACEEAIRRTRGAEASLRGFDAGYAAAAGHDHAGGKTQAVNAEEQKRWRGRPNAHARSLLERLRVQFPAETHRVLEEGVARLADYQDIAYANLYLDRLQGVLAAEKDAAGGPAGYKLTSETGRHLALWMSYEDVIRVADLKTRRSRFERVRAEVGAKLYEPVVVVEFLKPGIEEFCSVMPHAVGRAIREWAEKNGRRLNIGLHIKTNTVFGYLLLRSMAWLKPLRRRSLRFVEEQAMIERWLAAVLRAAEADLGLALEITECARLIKGYGDTHKRGSGDFLRIFETLADTDGDWGPAGRAEAIRKARDAALADPEGRNLGKELGAAKPVVWLSPQRAEMLSDKTA
jgi:indolepyruvate ferredoxin oxidoreductase, beta subunit